MLVVFSQVDELTIAVAQQPDSAAQAEFEAGFCVSVSVRRFTSSV